MKGILPPLVGDSKTVFKSKSGLIVAVGYKRVVIGGRGPYIEFDKENIVCDMISLFGITINFSNPSNPNNLYYYHLSPEQDKSIKIYFQLKTVKYADYKIGKFYISPDHLDMSQFEPVGLF